MTYIILFLFGILIISFATTIALYLDDHGSLAAFNTMITMPLFFTSSALMPYDVMPDWLRTVASVNPLSFAIDAIRNVNAGIIPVWQVSALGLMSTFVIAICIVVFRRTTL
ncbi:MAG: ABC-2 type transporter [Methanoregula sp. PtaU1.Bin051]|nr:MAG: ABC-2 type transporter [Methanoregula sp. PtaU1.Bin051]